ncbi:MAG: hypothetical protein AB7F23_09575 [Phycisphaerae bacterium]
MRATAALLVITAAIAACSSVYTDSRGSSSVTVEGSPGARRFSFTTTAPIRENGPKSVEVREGAGSSYCETGAALFDGLYALSLNEAAKNSVNDISYGAFADSPALHKPYWQTGEKWTYVWTRDLAYSVDLALAGIDAERSIYSLFFKTSGLKDGVEGDFPQQIIQDTGSGGSWPVSTDRAVWALAAKRLTNALYGQRKDRFIAQAWPFLRDTIELDRRLTFDESAGLYRGEQSFLDWRQQTYPLRTRDNVVLISQSASLSTNLLQYNLLKLASETASKQGSGELSEKYFRWAQELEAAIVSSFVGEDKCSAFILNNAVSIATERRDLLGESLAVLSGILSPEQARKVVESYPTGEFGPPVVWPQSRRVPIYHNQAIWPFVTAYHLRAAKQTGSVKVIDNCVNSLYSLTALNLSNMENYDFSSGLAYAQTNGISGPVINSPRQLWSVAAYINMVQEIIFGYSLQDAGLSVAPCITGLIHKNLFGGAREIMLNGLICHGKHINIKLQLPEPASSDTLYEVRALRLGGNKYGNTIEYNHLGSYNDIVVELGYGSESSDCIVIVDELIGDAIFGPDEPVVTEVSAKELVTLKWKPVENAETYRIYRNGEIAADSLRETEWQDKASGNYKTQPFYYNVCAYAGGNQSQISPALPATDYIVTVPALKMRNEGGELKRSHHFEDWGERGHSLECEFTARFDGPNDLYVLYSNGAYNIESAVTCSVKRLRVYDGDDNLLCEDYLKMPHTEETGSNKRGWDVFRDSASVSAELKKGERYRVVIDEDQYSRNMSYYKHYVPYRNSGGGAEPYNFVNIAELRVAPAGR